MTRTVTLMTWTALAAAQTAQKPLVIEHVRVFDGTSVIADTNVVVEGGMIGAMGATVARPAGAEVVDGKGKTLLPGLIDSHTHTIGAASLEQAPIFGVTTDLDMFTDPRMAVDVKKQQKEGKLANYADLRSAGYLATAPGGHGTEYGLKVPTLTQPTRHRRGWTRGSPRVRTISRRSTTMPSSMVWGSHGQRSRRQH